MPTFPVVTGDVLTSTIFNGLPAFAVQVAKTVDYLQCRLLRQQITQQQVVMSTNSLCK